MASFYEEVTALKEAAERQHEADIHKDSHAPQETTREKEMPIYIMRSYTLRNRVRGIERSLWLVRKSKFTSVKKGYAFVQWHIGIYTYKHTYISIYFVISSRQ